MQKLAENGRFYIAQDLAVGDVLPVGSSAFKSDEFWYFCKLDFDHESVRAIFSKVDARAAQLNLSRNDAIQGILKYPIDIQLLNDMWAVNDVLQHSGHVSTRNDEGEIINSHRAQIYDRDSTYQLSDVIEAKSAECSEVAALTQYYLQSKGYNVQFINGDFANQTGDEVFPHAFLSVLDRRGNRFIFDISNQAHYGTSLVPSVFSIDNTTYRQWIDVASDKRRGFLGARNIFDDRIVRYFGIHDIDKGELEPEYIINNSRTRGDGSQ
jgi:hypothetical protein